MTREREGADEREQRRWAISWNADQSSRYLKLGGNSIGLAGLEFRMRLIASGG